MIRGRGNRSHNLGRGGRTRAPPYNRSPKPHVVIRPAFDLTTCESTFQRVVKVDNIDLQMVLEQKLLELKPTALELSNLNLMVIEVQKVFETLIASSNNFSGCQVEEIKVVGSLKKGTLIKKHGVADIVVVLQTLPFQKTIEVLAVRVLDDLKKLMSLPQVHGYSYELNENGFMIVGPLGSVRIRISTVPSNLSKLDTTIHLPQKVLEIHSQAIKHVTWFAENANDTIRNLVRLLKDLRNRFDGLSSLSVWMIELLAVYALKPPRDATETSVKTESDGFRRCLQLISSGLFLIGSTGLVDPCDNQRWVHNSITLENQDVLCATGQLLLRILSFGGAAPLMIGQSDMLQHTRMWKNIIINKAEKVYEKSAEKPTVDTSAVTTEVTADDMDVSTGAE